MRDGDIFRAPDVRRSLFFGVPNTDKDDNNWEILSGGVHLEQDIGDTWLATLKLNGTSTDQPIDQDSYAYVYNFDDFSNTGNVGLYSSAFDAENDVWSGELRLAGRFDLLDRPATFAFGADHGRVDIERVDAFVSLGTANIYEQNFADFPTVQPTTPSSNFVQDSETTGVYAELSLRPIQRLNVLLSGRHDWADSSSKNRLVPGSKTDKKEERTTNAGRCLQEFHQRGDRPDGHHDHAAQANDQAVFEVFEPPLQIFLGDQSIGHQIGNRLCLHFGLLFGHADRSEFFHVGIGIKSNGAHAQEYKQQQPEAQSDLRGEHYAGACRERGIAKCH
jgi:outer membrane receptor protein involved in Fe transport